MSLLRNDFPYPGGVSLLFDQPVALLTDMREAIGMLTVLATEQLRRDRRLTRKITVWMETQYREGSGPELSSRSTDLPVPVNDPRLLTVFTYGAVDELYRPGARYRAAGVYYEDLSIDEAAMAAPSSLGSRAMAPASRAAWHWSSPSWSSPSWSTRSRPRRRAVMGAMPA